MAEDRSLASPGKRGKNGAKDRRIGPFLPFFPGEAKILFLAIFFHPHFGPEVQHPASERSLQDQAWTGRNRLLGHFRAWPLNLPRVGPLLGCLPRGGAKSSCSELTEGMGVRICTCLFWSFGGLRGPEILFISRDTCSDRIAKLVGACFHGSRTIIARYIAKWGIAQMCLCEDKCHGLRNARPAAAIQNPNTRKSSKKTQKLPPGPRPQTP